MRQRNFSCSEKGLTFALSKTVSVRWAWVITVRTRMTSASMRIIVHRILTRYVACHAHTHTSQQEPTSN